MTDSPAPTGRLVILWSNGTSYATDMPAALADQIMSRVSTGRWSEWSWQNQRGIINPAHVADLTFTLADQPAK